jgi:hypothetical protein
VLVAELESFPDGQQDSDQDIVAPATDDPETDLGLASQRNSIEGSDLVVDTALLLEFDAILANLEAANVLADREGFEHKLVQAV